MVKKNPDKFERMIIDMGDPPFEGVEVYAQFRQYHREVVEMVRGCSVPVSQCATVEECHARNEAIGSVLRRLEELAK